MRRLLFAVLLVLGLGLPAWALTPVVCTATWTNGQGDRNWLDCTNWTGVAAGKYPGPGSTLTFIGTVVPDGTNLPTDGLPGSGAFTVSISGYTANLSLTNFGLAGCTVTAKTIVVGAGKTLTASMNIDENTSISAAGAGAVLAGVLTASAPNAVITWTNLAITGNIAAAGYTITHNGTGGTLTVNAAATLDAGTATAGAFAVNITNAAGTVTISKLLTTGTVIFNAAGNITLPAAIQTGAWTVTTVATLTCAASPGTTVSAGGTVLGTAIGTLTGNLNLTLTGTGKTLYWIVGDEGGPSLDLLTVTGSYTMTDAFVLSRRVAGTGSVDLGGFDFDLFPTADDFFTGTVAFTNGNFVLNIETSVSNAANINLGDTTVQVFTAEAAADRVLTASGGFQTTGDISVGHAILAWRTSLVVSGDFACRDATLAWSGAGGPATVTLGAAGNHAFRNVARRAGNLLTTHALNLAGRCTVSGNLALAGITANFGGARITAGAASAVNGLNATGLTNTRCDFLGDGGTKVFTFSNLGACTPPLRAWCGCIDGSGNAAGSIEIHPTPPGGMNMMGMGACLNRRWLRNAA